MAAGRSTDYLVGLRAAAEQPQAARTVPPRVIGTYDAVTAPMPASRLRCTKPGSILTSALLVAASGCGDGVGQPIFAAGSNNGVGTSAGAATVTSGGRYSNALGGGGGAIATTTVVAPLDCSTTQQWPTEWTAAEDDLLILLNMYREAGLPCLTSTTASDIPAPTLTNVPTLRCAARLHSGSGFSGAGAAARIVGAGFPANQIAEVVLATHESDSDAASVFATLLLSENQNDCTYPMDPQYTSVGIGFAYISDVGYWTIDLASE